MLNLRPDIAVYGKKIIDPRGFYIAGQIELTSSCFQRCAFCDFAAKRKAYPTPWTLQRMLVMTARLASEPDFENLTLTGGDPQAWGPLEEYLKTIEVFFQSSNRPSFLNMNTALMLPVTPVYRVLRTVRVSFDAHTKAGYRATRGIGIDPEVVLERVAQLQALGVSVAFNVCVSSRNINLLLPLVARLAKTKARKIILLPVLEGNDEAFWDRWEAVGKEIRATAWGLETSIGEDPRKAQMEIPAMADGCVRCWASWASFHLKSNGDLFPCCLVGGEAVPTTPGMRLGNVFETDIGVLRRQPPGEYYQFSRCRAICQFKQISLNQAGHIASTCNLRIP